jgi:hypothetical protein
MLLFSELVLSMKLFGERQLALETVSFQIEPKCRRSWSRLQPRTSCKAPKKGLTICCIVYLLTTYKQVALILLFSSLSVVLPLLSDRTDMQSILTLTRNLNLIGAATQTSPSSLTVPPFSNAFGVRSVRSSISFRHHAQVVSWIYVLGTCIHHCNIPAAFHIYFVFLHTIRIPFISLGRFFFQIWNADLGPSFCCCCCCFTGKTYKMSVMMMTYM